MKHFKSFGLLVVLALLSYLHAGNWSFFPKDANYGEQKGDDLRIVIPPGGEKNCGFGQFQVPAGIPAGVPVKIGFWSRTDNVTGVPGKKMRLGFSGSLTAESGKTLYPGLYAQRSKDWRWNERTFTFDEKVVSYKYLYMMAFDLSGTVEYEDVYFGPWTAVEIAESERPFVAAPEKQGELWQNGAAFGSFRVLGSQQVAKNPTETFLAADRENLYINIRAYSDILDPVLQQLDRFRATVTEENGPVHRDDAIEIFIESPEGDYIHLACNALGTKYIGRQSGKVPAGDWRVVALRTDKYWQAEIVIPWKKLGYSAKPDKKLRFNIARHDSANAEFSSWSLVKSGFHEFENFGSLGFCGRTAQLREIEPLPTVISPGVNAFQYKLSAANEAEVRLDMQVFDKTTGSMEVERVKLAAGQEQPVKLTASFGTGDRYRARVRLLDKDGNLLYRGPLVTMESKALIKATHDLKLPGGEVRLSLNGKEVNTPEFFLGRGENTVSIRAKGNGTLSGKINLRSDDAVQNESIAISEQVSGEKEIIRKIYIGQSQIAYLDVSDGLYVEKGGVQHVPFAIANPAGKIVDILMPAGVEVLSFALKDSYKDVKLLQKAARGEHTWYQVQLSVPESVKSYVLGFTVEMTGDVPAPFYYRANGNGDYEVWNKMDWKILPPLNAPSPKKLWIEMGHTFGVGVYGENEVEGLLKSMKSAGINTYWERVACYNSSLWVDAVRKLGLRLVVRS